MKDSADLEHTLLELRGSPAWGVSRSHGSMFFIELGESIAHDGMNARGEWRFLFEMCHWRFEAAQSLLVGSDDPTAAIDGIFSKLDLGLITSCDFVPTSRDLMMSFSVGIQFRTFSTSVVATHQWKQWSLYTPEKNCWTLDSKGKISCRNIHE